MPSIRIETPQKSQRISALTIPSPTAKLDINYFTSDNAGEYSCIAENEYGERAIERFQLNTDTGIVEPPRIRVEPRDIEVMEGSNVFINTSYTV
jgi:hypothetical protein